MLLCRVVTILCLTVSASQSQDNCVGPGFTQTIPARQEWSQYSTTVLKPGDPAVYSSLSFACNGTLQSLAIPSIVRGSFYWDWNQYLYILVSVWRFNETGYYQVREFQDSVVPESSVFWATVSIFPQMEVRAKDTLAFRLLLPHGPMYRHVSLLFKPGPSPGAFIPVVSANFTASSGPVTEPISEPRPSSTLCDCSTSSANVFSQKCITGNTEIVADTEMNTTKGLITAPQASVQAMDSSTVNALGGLLALSLLLLLVLTVVVVVLAVMLKRARSVKTITQENVYYNGVSHHSLGSAGAITLTLPVAHGHGPAMAAVRGPRLTSETLSVHNRTQQGHVNNEAEEQYQYLYVPSSSQRKDPTAIYGTVEEKGIYSTLNEGNYEMGVDVHYWSPAPTTEAIFDQMSKSMYLEIPLSSLNEKSKLGEGEFGEVFKGEWTSSARTLPVALKTLKSSASEEERLKLLQEAAIMGQFNHPHIVRLYGVVTLSEPVMIVMELLEGCDLRNHLMKLRTMNQRSVTPDSRRLPEQLLRFCQEIAGAMHYLSKKGFIHRDIAARNILLTADMKCKLADFGMSHDMDEDYYYKPKGGRIPVKWTAPEAVLYKKYTTKSDVWSYGMVMYEIWSLGHKPFEDFNTEEVVRALSTGYCQPPPPGCPRGVYTIMVKCWHPDYHSRVSFTEVVQSLNYDQRALLKVDPRDKTGSPLSLTLGAPLEHGQELHKDLQDTYK